jgi:hypothetical protein
MTNSDKLEKRGQTRLYARFPAFEMRIQPDGIKQSLWMAI